ncbi:MAG TPA: neutral zinc metallopeptidase [Acidimicrobiales bacterium]
MLVLLAAAAIVDRPSGEPADRSFMRQGRLAQPYDEMLAFSLGDLEQWWKDEFRDLYGSRFKDLAEGVWAVQPQLGAPGCGDDDRTRYDDVEGNAFYCSPPDMIAWDDTFLIPRLSEVFGEFGMALVLAHEWGHAVQARGDGFDAPSVVTELQADCFAGAWLRHVDDGENEELDMSDRELDGAVAAILQLADSPGTRALDPGAHGNGFDRTGALQDGYFNGTQACKGYVDSPPPITETGFDSVDQQLTAGKMTPSRLVPLVRDDLSAFFTELAASLGRSFAPPELIPVQEGQDVPECKGLTGSLERRIVTCEGGTRIVFDYAAFEQASSALGDFATSTLLAEAYSAAAQEQLGAKAEGDLRALQGVCGAGAWASDVAAHPREALDVAPGDLDAAISAVLLYGSVSPDQDATAGRPFDRVAAYRLGVLGGPSACKV